MKTLCTILLPVCLFFYACSENKKPTQQENEITETEKDSLLVKYQSLKDSLNAGWAFYTKKEDIILDNMDHILKHLSYSATYDRSKHRKLEKKVKRLRKIRYTQDDFSNIDKFDRETDKLILELIEFAEETEDASMAVIGDFIDEMNTENGFLVNYRIYYDKFVFEYNEFVTKNKDSLIDSGIKKKELKEMPTFAISNEEDSSV